MPFVKGHPGGPGRPPKPVEDAQRSVLLELFDEAAERAVVKNMLAIAKGRRSPLAVSAATWLWDRKYGKVKDVVDQETVIRVVRESRGNAGHRTPDAASAAAADTE